MYIQLERRDYRDVCTAAVAQQMRLPVPSPVLRMVTRMQAVDGSGFPIVNICKYTNMQCVCVYLYIYMIYDTNMSETNALNG